MDPKRASFPGSCLGMRQSRRLQSPFRRPTAQRTGGGEREAGASKKEAFPGWSLGTSARSGASSMKVQHAFVCRARSALECARSSAALAVRFARTTTLLSSKNAFDRGSAEPRSEQCFLCAGFGNFFVLHPILSVAYVLFAFAPASKTAASGATASRSLPVNISALRSNVGASSGGHSASAYAASSKRMSLASAAHWAFERRIVVIPTAPAEGFPRACEQVVGLSRKR